MRTIFKDDPAASLPPSAIPMSPVDLLERLRRPGVKPLVIDVRENSERAVCTLAEAVHIPMWEIPGKMETLDRERDIVVLCHHGIRSLQIADYLLRAGFKKVYNLTGGIHAWAVQVDPSMARY